MDILIVDDEEFILEQSKYYLKEENDDFNINTVSSAEKGLELLENKDHDIVVSDYQMPGMNGLDFLKSVQEKKIDIPFIMFTGRGREEVAIQALNLGADRYVQKGGDPVSQYKVLASAIQKAVELKENERSIKSRRRKIESLHRIAADMEKCRNEQEVYDLTVDAAENILDFFVCSILVHEDGYMVMRATKDTRVDIGTKQDVNKGIYGLTYRKKKPFIVSNIREYEEANPTDPEFKSVLSIPIGEVGVFQALSREFDSFDENDLDMAKLLISHTIEAVKRIRYDQARRESEKKYRNIVENSLDVIYAVNLDGIIEYVSPQIKRFGYDPKKVIGEKIDKFLFEEDKKRIYDTFLRVLENGEEKKDKITFRFKNKDGGITYLEENSNIIKEDGEVKQVAGVMRDVTERVEVKKQLKEGKEEFKNLFENSPIGLLDMDFSKIKERLDILKNEGVEDIKSYMDENPNFVRDMIDLIKINNINKNIKDLYQIDNIQDLYTNMEKLFTHRTFELFEEVIDNIFSGGRLVYGENINYTCGGKKIYVYTTWSAVPGHVDNYDKVIVSIEDITERKKAEKKLKQSEKRLQTLYENITSGTLIIGDDYRIRDVNKRTCEITGYSRDELIGELCDIVCPKGSKSLKCPIFEKGKTEFKGMDTKIKCKDGSQNPILKNAKSLEIGDKQYIMENFQDIRERKRFEERILKEKQKIEKLHDVANRFEKCNSEEAVYDLVIETAVNILGFEKLCSIEIIEEDQVFFKKISREDERVYDQKPLSESGYVKKTYENKESYMIENASEDLDAEPVKEKYKSGISVPIGNKGVFQAIGFDRDEFNKGDLKLAELLISHAEEALKRINSEKRFKFLHSLLRHDLKNKNQIVQGYLNLIEGDNLSKDDIELLKKAERNTKEGIDLIEKIKILSELEEEEITNVEIGKVINEVVEKIFSEEYSEDFKIEVQEISHLVRGGSLLNELFSNLITNSLIHSKGDKIRITSKIEDGSVIISLEDNGEGIPKEYKDRIFEKGFKKGNYSGSGLGLYLVKKISQYYGGSISLKDSDLGGTRFDIRLNNAQPS